MKNNPRVSIITVCYNCKDELEKTIKSVLNQTCKDFEYIIIDGGSEDGTVDVIKKYRSGIDYWVSEKDSGVYNAMNKGSKVAHGEYLYFLNAGDIFHNEETLKMIEEELNKSDMLYGNVKVLNGHARKGKKLSKTNLRLGAKVSQQAVFISRDVFDSINGLNEKYKIAADFDLLCKVFEYTNNIRYINRTICDYEGGGISSNLKKSYDDTAKVIKDRYGILYFTVYKVITSAKLFISLFIGK